ncbi:MAG: DUF2069 domain-containing protein [Vibrio sp.]|uniref:DUF2069 domain-containing protein n=1 Tax=Vibrio sp. TaxID=678 RepID=UPI003A84D05C
MSVEMTSKTKQLRWLALSSNIALIVWIALWQLQLSPHPHLNSMALTVGWLIPLLLPLPGILSGKPYTHAWANFILMLYFLHAFTILYVDDGERWLAAIELLFTCSAFLGNVLYARHRGKELGLKLTKLSVVEKQEKQRFNQE